jgi:hypothetical protein
MKSFKQRLILGLWSLASSFLWAQASPSTMPLNLQVQVIKEDASLYSGQPFWLGFQVRVSPGTQMSWHLPLSGRSPTQFRIKLPKPLVATQWIWPMPKVVWRENNKIDVFYESSFTVLAQVQWSGSFSLTSRLNALEMAQWFLQTEASWGKLVERVDLSGDFSLPSVRLPNEVPLAQDPLVLSEFARVFYNMPQRLDPALVDWKIEGGQIQMIIRQPINNAQRWAVIPTHSRVELPKSVSLAVASAEQKVQGRDVMLVFDNAIRKQWARAGVDEVMIVDDKGQQALVVSLELETVPALSWIEKVSQWWNLQIKTGIKSALRV